MAVSTLTTAIHMQVPFGFGAVAPTASIMMLLHLQPALCCQGLQAHDHHGTTLGQYMMLLLTPTQTWFHKTLGSSGCCTQARHEDKA